MSLETKRIKELFGYARTLTKEQGVGVMAARAAGFFKRRFFGKKARYLPAKQTLDTQRADAGQNAKNWPAISILTPLYNTPPQFLQQFLDSVQGQTSPNWQLVLVDASDAAHTDVERTVQARAASDPRNCCPARTPTRRWTQGSTARSPPVKACRPKCCCTPSPDGRSGCPPRSTPCKTRTARCWAWSAC